MNIFSLKNKRAVVTGASRGIGKAIAIGLAQAGADVVCSSTSKEGSKDTVEAINKIGRKAFQVVANLSNRSDQEKLISTSIDLLGGLDILVNNAGTIFREKALDHAIADWDRVLEVNLTSAFRLSQFSAQHMGKQKSGKIINIASLLSFFGGITVPAYTASKHGIAGLTKALSNEWAALGIQVNAIAPGYIRTDNTQALQDDPVRHKMIQDRIPAGRWGLPEDLVGAAVFLASGASDFVGSHTTGHWG